MRGPRNSKSLRKSLKMDENNVVLENGNAIEINGKTPAEETTNSTSEETDRIVEIPDEKEPDEVESEPTPKEDVKKEATPKKPKLKGKKKAAKKGKKTKKEELSVDTDEKEGSSSEAPKDDKDADDVKDEDGEEEEEEEAVPEPRRARKRTSPTKTTPTPSKKKKKNQTVHKKGKAEPVEYEVEKILDERKKGDSVEYKVRWKGYGSSYDTWEPITVLKCDDLLNQFRASGNKKEGISKDQTRSSKRFSGRDNSKKRTNYSKDSASEDEAEESPSESGDAEYEVEKILEADIKEDGSILFLVKWKGFSEKANTYEPVANLNCPDLLRGFVEMAHKSFQDLSFKLDKTSRREAATPPKKKPTRLPKRAKRV